jgi:light-regulated signal transduction histidine kinase (bacteriophytochrome)
VITVFADFGMGDSYIDNHRIERVLLNLITNASKYTAEGGRVAVEINDLGKYHSVQVTDTGRGIPEDDLELIFSPFYRSKTPDTVSVAGTGLGLSIARFLAEQHEGSLTAVSTVGVGSTFTLMLPARGPLGTESAVDLPVVGQERPRQVTVGIVPKPTASLPAFGFARSGDSSSLPNVMPAGGD